MQEGLSYADRLPVRWHPAPVPEAEGVRTRLEEGNEQALRALALLEERPPERPAEAPAEEGQPSAQELARIEAKLNLLLALVGRLMARERALPPSRPVRLGGMGVSWETEEPPPSVGERGLVEIYPLPDWPEALRLPGEVVAVEPLGEGRHRVEVRFEAMGETAREALEKLVFRHHRRSVARARQHARQDPDAGS